jgi:CheY-like chemotaxis protein
MSTGPLWLNDSQQALDYLLCGGRYERRAPTPPLLVMTDIHMPCVSGLELLTRIRAEPRLRMLPVVVLSASADLDEVRECFRLGADGYVGKVVAHEVFVEQVTLMVRHWLIASICFPATDRPHPWQHACQRDEHGPGRASSSP